MRESGNWTRAILTSEGYLLKITLLRVIFATFFVCVKEVPRFDWRILAKIGESQLKLAQDRPTFD